MTFEEYQQAGRTRYLAFVDAIQNILRHILHQHSLTAHAITGRAKELTSLRKKLRDRGIEPDQRMDDIKDLAGCRVVFLTNSQVDAFNRTGALRENFDVLNVNVHHPVPGTDTKTKLFDSTNYLVRLKSERLALAEYQGFDGLCAEIQIQTLLNHAWAEMGHDTIYKEPNLTHLGKARMTAIGERMNKVMQDHLIPAGHDFDKIARDFRQLLRADGDAEATLEAIHHIDNNNDLEDALETYIDLVLPHYDEPAKEFSKLLETFIGAVERSRGYPVVPIVTPFGEFQGKTGLDIARRVNNLLGSYRYVEPDRTFHALVRLYLGARAEDERRLWIEGGKKLADHNLDVWKRYGPAAQQFILNELKQLDPEKTTACRPLLVAMLARVLSADLKGTTWSSDRVLIHQGVVHASEELRRLREESIGWLEQWLDAAASDADRLTILQALDEATVMSMQNGDDAGLIQMLLEDGARVAALIFARAPKWNLELRRGREINALHIHHSFHVLQPSLAEKPELVAAQKKLIDALLGLRDQLASDDDFVLYKTLIGHNSIRPDAWAGNHFDYEATNAWRHGRYPAIIANMTAESVPEWTLRINTYLDAAGNRSGHFTPMREFLGLLAEEKPDVALLMLEEVSAQQATFLPAMLAGIERAGRKEEIFALVDRWLPAGQFLPALGAYLQSRPEVDLERLQAYMAKAIELEDKSTVVNAATIAANWYKRAPDQTLINNVFMPVIQFTSDRQHVSWINDFFAPDNALIVQALSEKQSRDFLASFVGIAEVDHGEVQLLIAVGRHYPQLVIDFFSARIQHKRGETKERFEPIPIYPHDLAQALSPHADLLLQTARQWYEDDPCLHEFYGGRLLKHAFCEVTEEVAAQLIELARSGNENDLKFILDTLRPYESAEQIYPVCMEVVDRLEPGDKLLNKLSSVLDKTGMLSGEFGYVEAHAFRRDLIERYLDDPRPRVRAYVQDRARVLAQSMAWEQREAERDVAQRRRDWNEE